MRITDYLSQIQPNILKLIERNVCSYLDKCGLYYRIFSRCKTAESIAEKCAYKNYSQNKKMQDLLGCRIILYFQDDVSLCGHIISSVFPVDNISKDELNDDTFKPIRLNYVCKLPDEIISLLPEGLWNHFPIDKTFEIQVRTIFSEGWHEIEHDLRYKCKSDWDNCNDLSRNLNGIFATLETCDWSLKNIFEQLAYKKYKEREWAAMIRNKLRIRLLNSPISDTVQDVLVTDNNFAKSIIRVDRENFILFLSNPQIIPIPKSIDNILFFINELYIGNDQVHKIAPPIILEQMEKYKLSENNKLSDSSKSLDVSKKLLEYSSGLVDNI